MMALEIYYKKIYELPFEWLDPPDPLHAPPCAPLNVPAPVFYTPPGGWPPPYASRPHPISPPNPPNEASTPSKRQQWSWLVNILR